MYVVWFNFKRPKDAKTLLKLMHYLTSMLMAKTRKAFQKVSRNLFIQNLTWEHWLGAKVEKKERKKKAASERAGTVVVIADYSCFTIVVAFNDETWQVNYRAEPVSLDTQTRSTYLAAALNSLWTGRVNCLPRAEFSVQKSHMIWSW